MYVRVCVCAPCAKWLWLTYSVQVGMIDGKITFDICAQAPFVFNYPLASKSAYKQTYIHTYILKYIHMYILVYICVVKQLTIVSRPGPLCRLSSCASCNVFHFVHVVESTSRHAQPALNKRHTHPRQRRGNHPACRKVNSMKQLLWLKLLSLFASTHTHTHTLTWEYYFRGNAK